MAQGVPPLDACVEMPQGLWVTPRWLGMETTPALVLALIELGGLVARSLPIFTATTAFVLVWAWILKEAFARDEQTVAIFFRNRHFLRLSSVRDEALVSTRIEHLERIF